MRDKNIDGWKYEINSHQKLLNWIAFWKKLLLSNWGYQFDWVPLIAKGYNAYVDQIQSSLHSSVFNSFCIYGRCQRICLSVCY